MNPVQTFRKPVLMILVEAGQFRDNPFKDKALEKETLEKVQFSLHSSPDLFGDVHSRSLLAFTEGNSRNATDLKEILNEALGWHQQKKSHFPLYIALEAENINLIAALSRMGALPFMGEWSFSSRKDNESLWEEITDILRETN